MLLVAALLLAMAVAAARGAVPIPLDHVAQITLRRLGFPIAASWSPAEEAILWQLRLPRVVTAALVGAALAGSGALLQGLFRKPLAVPYVLGISAGAVLAAMVTMAMAAVGAGGGGVCWFNR